MTSSNSGKVLCNFESVNALLMAVNTKMFDEDRKRIEENFQKDQLSGTISVNSNTVPQTFKETKNRNYLKARMKTFHQHRNVVVIYYRLRCMLLMR